MFSIHSVHSVSVERCKRAVVSWMMLVVMVIIMITGLRIKTKHKQCFLPFSYHYHQRMLMLLSFYSLIKLRWQLCNDNKVYKAPRERQGSRQQTSSQKRRPSKTKTMTSENCLKSRHFYFKKFYITNDIVKLQYNLTTWSMADNVCCKKVCTVAGIIRSDGARKMTQTGVNWIHVSLYMLTLSIQFPLFNEWRQYFVRISPPTNIV